MDFRTELSKWGYNKGNSIDVEILVNEILPSLFSKQERSYNEEEVIELLQKAITHKDDGEIGSLVTAQGQIRPANFFSWFKQFKKKQRKHEQK